MFSCYIIDDERHPVELLTDYIERTPDITLSGSALDPVRGLHEVLQNPPDLLFLDVDMPVLSGFDLHKLVSGSCSVVFTTAYPKYAVGAYDVEAVDFLLKPIRYERFLRAVQKVMAENRQQATEARDFMFIQSGVKSKLVKISFEDILYVESLHNYINIHTRDGHHIVYLSLKDLLEKLPPEKFCRIHRSHIINYRKIRYIEGNRLWLEGSPELSIGTQYKNEFFGKVHKDLLKK